MNLLALLKTLRPHQWVKNIFVLAPLVFSKNLLSLQHLLPAVGAMALFCLASGVVYLINDLVDIERDRNHPVKRLRPIASGALSVGAARLAAALLGPGVLVSGYLVSRPLALVLASYITLNLFYSIVLKHLPYLDVLSIAAGFLLRVLGGALALNVVASVWLLVCTALLACYLGLGKRAHELTSLGDEAGQARSVLERYRLSHVKLVMLVVALATLVAYVLYTISAETQAAFGTGYLAVTCPFTLIGLLRFYQLVTKPLQNASPTDEMLRDLPFIANVALWGLTVLVVIYL
jgi:decaprenyl-phosphate phosphoribosyltransferase